MVSRRLTGTISSTFAVALLCASTIGCEARPNLLAGAQSDCTSCHGQPPPTDAHLAHTTLDSSGVPHAAFGCNQCHLDVTSRDQPGHIIDASGVPNPAPAVVRFADAESLAAKTLGGSTRAALPQYDKAARTCSNVYCHGATLRGATSDVLAAPAWDAPAGTVSCGKCHGLPPANHPAHLELTDCARCHGAAIDAAGKPNPAKHVNGTVDFAVNVTSSCAACHGSGAANVPPGDARSAPPRDAEGRDATDPTATAIGAHQNHVVAGTLGVAVACSECHSVPTTLLDPAHFDNQVTVTFGPLAAKGGLTPSYDPATQTCSSVYCHGNFPNSKPAGTPVPKPTWRQGDAAVACGTCHGLPPPSPAHPDPATFGVPTGCNGPSNNPALQCHPSRYTPTTVDPTLHIDGKICPPFCGP
jgi:predicted CxxxxCH...CXXCH cytochrome family protein